MLVLDIICCVVAVGANAWSFNSWRGLDSSERIWHRMLSVIRGFFALLFGTLYTLQAVGVLTLHARARIVVPISAVSVSLIYALPAFRPKPNSRKELIAEIERLASQAKKS
jgi:hypothetical protein